KIENLAAGLESLLLIITAVWILSESLHRILVNERQLELSIWAFVVMIGSIVADYWRSNLLMRAAIKFRSQAMEADALNFRADMWSSGVVILGLLFVYIGRRFDLGGPWEQADSLAAIIVSLLIIRIAVKLAYQAVQILLDRAPTELSRQM